MPEAKASGSVDACFQKTKVFFRCLRAILVYRLQVS